VGTPGQAGAKTIPDLKKIQERLAVIEKFFGSALARLRKLENM
jgi:hypothetical protein